MKKAILSNLKMIGILVGVLATFMIFLPALGIKDSDSTFTGIEVAMGHEFANIGTLVSGQIKFSIMTLLAYLLPVVGAFLLKFSKKGYLYSAVAFIAAILMLFLIPEFTVVTIDILGNINEIEMDWTYAIGLIVAMILSAAGLVTSLIGLSNKES
jgi:hypothetical protein